jgi:Bacteriophage minor capsid protein
MPNVSVADDVADLFAAAGWTGWSVFVNEMPPEPDQAVGIFEAGGPPPGTRLDIDRPSVQVRVRAGKHDWPTARAKIKDAFDLLHKRTGTLTGTYYVAIMATGDVLTLGLDANERPELAQTYEAIRSRG